MPTVDPRIAVDLDPRNRPGVPKERAPVPWPGATWPIPRQQSPLKVYRHGRPKSMPPVYGTAQPPRGLSGRLRAVAYGYPDHLVRHWLLLMAADRVNVLESRLGPVQGLGLLAGSALLGRRVPKAFGLGMALGGGILALQFLKGPKDGFRKDQHVLGERPTHKRYAELVRSGKGYAAPDAPSPL